MGWAGGYIAKLQQGETVSFRPRGDSMKGRIESPIVHRGTDYPKTIEVGDIVLCRVGGSQRLEEFEHRPDKPEDEEVVGIRRWRRHVVGGEDRAMVADGGGRPGEMQTQVAAVDLDRLARDERGESRTR